MDCFYIGVAPEAVYLVEEADGGGGVRGGALPESSAVQWWLPPPDLQFIHRFNFYFIFKLINWLVNDLFLIY